MKARDLAALAALGIAGKYAYDKYSEKTAPAKKKMGEGLDMTNQGAYELATRPRFEGAAVEKTSRQESDIPEALSRQERDVPDRIMGRDAAGSRFTERAAAPVASDAYKKLKAAGANSRAPAAVDEASPKTRAFTPPGAQTSMDAFTNAGQSDAAAPQTRAFTPPGYVASANDYNRASVPDMPNTMALGAYTRAVNPAMQADRMLAASHPSARITDKLAMTSRANQAAYLAQQRAEQARLDALRSSGGRRAKGGVVKMASGGKVTSKPSGASRGDGIAQRGRTRGKYL